MQADNILPTLVVLFFQDVSFFPYACVSNKIFQNKNLALKSQMQNEHTLCKDEFCPKFEKKPVSKVQNKVCNDFRKFG